MQAWISFDGRFCSFEQKLANALAENGAEEQRIRYELQSLESNQTNLGQAYGRIVDLDYAAESTRLIKKQILTQSSAEMMGLQLGKPMSS